MAKFLSAREALSRMKRGDLPTAGGGYTSALHFDDGRRTSGPVGHRLVKSGKVNPPEHSSVNSPYTLAQETKPTFVNHGNGKRSVTVNGITWTATWYPAVAGISRYGYWTIQRSDRDYTQGNDWYSERWATAKMQMLQDIDTTRNNT